MKLRGAHASDVGLALQPPVSQALIASMVLAELERAGEERHERVHRDVEAVKAALYSATRFAVLGAERRLLAQPLKVDPARAGRRGGPRGHGAHGGRDDRGR